MSQLHPTEEDNAFALGHADGGLRKALRRIERLEGLLRRAREALPSGSLEKEIGKAIAMTYYEEEDDGTWRLPNTKR